MGRLIPAGTGMPRYRYMGIRIEGADEDVGDESVLDVLPPRPVVLDPQPEGLMAGPPAGDRGIEA
ncbi:MAG: hypothetical protein GY725_11160 [bacterium]|nr:hypothetical protein [bacterium]